MSIHQRLRRLDLLDRQANPQAIELTPGQRLAKLATIAAVLRGDDEAAKADLLRKMGQLTAVNAWVADNG
jgi:hypothetical protein